MVLPIYAYGQNVLKQKASDISSDHKNLKELIDDMYETMYAAKGVGLAAPQIGKSIRLFIIDTSPFENEEFDTVGDNFIDFSELNPFGDPRNP